MKDLTNIITDLEVQLSAIENALSALRGISQAERPKRGRPAGASQNGSGKALGLAKKAHISEEGRRRLARSMKKRWAAKRAAAKKQVG